MKPPRVLGPLLVALFALAGCGHSSGSGYHWSSLYRQDVRTVAVPIFTNVDFQRNVEFALTKSVVNQIEAATPYKVVPKERADTILEGHITGVKVNTVSNDYNSAVPQQQVLDVTIDFTWKDLRTGRLLVDRRGFEQTASYYPTLGEGRWTGTQQATEKLAKSIVQELQTDW